MAAPPGQAPWRFAREAAQRLGRGELREAAFDQCLGAGCGQAGVVGVVGQQRLLVAAAFFLEPDGLVVLAVIGILDGLAAAKVKIEQPVEGYASLRRRGEGGQCRLPDIPEVARAEQLDRSEERGSLFRRDGKSVGA